MSQPDVEKSSYYQDKPKGGATKNNLGLIHACVGPGVGKSTRSVGLAVRAAGSGLKVFFVQFMKSGDSGEVSILSGIDNITYRSPGNHPFILAEGPKPVHNQHAERALSFAKEAAAQGMQLIVCDELLSALLFKVVSLHQVLGLVELCRGKADLVMTGVDAPPEIQRVCDYVTEFRQVKHPYYAGYNSRRGIEF